MWNEIIISRNEICVDTMNFKGFVPPNITAKHYKNLGHPQKSVEIHRRTIDTVKKLFEDMNHGGSGLKRGPHLGSGGFGTVFEIMDVEVHETSGMKRRKSLAVKEVNISTLTRYSPQIERERVKRIIKKEIDRMTLLQHPNVCRIVGSFSTKGQFGNVIVRVVMEKYDINGDQFLSILEQKRVSEYRQTIECLIFLMEVAKGLKYIHSFGIIHFDIKPQNILLCLNQKDEIIKCVISDFGSAKEEKMSFMLTTMPGITKRFSAPEICHMVENRESSSKKTGANNVFTKKSDIFSYGIVMGFFSRYYEEFPKLLELQKMCVDTDPFERPTLVEIIYHLRASLIHKCKRRRNLVIRNLRREISELKTRHGKKRENWRIIDLQKGKTIGELKTTISKIENDFIQQKKRMEEVTKREINQKNEQLQQLGKKVDELEKKNKEEVDRVNVMTKRNNETESTNQKLRKSLEMKRRELHDLKKVFESSLDSKKYVVEKTSQKKKEKAGEIEREDKDLESFYNQLLKKKRLEIGRQEDRNRQKIKEMRRGVSKVEGIIREYERKRREEERKRKNEERRREQERINKEIRKREEAEKKKLQEFLESKRVEKPFGERGILYVFGEENRKGVYGNVIGREKDRRHPDRHCFLKPTFLPELLNESVLKFTSNCIPVVLLENGKCLKLEEDGSPKEIDVNGHFVLDICSSGGETLFLTNEGSIYSLRSEKIALVAESEKEEKFISVCLGSKNLFYATLDCKGRVFRWGNIHDLKYIYLADFNNQESYYRRIREERSNSYVKTPQLVNVGNKFIVQVGIGKDLVMLTKGGEVLTLPKALKGKEQKLKSVCFESYIDHIFGYVKTPLKDIVSIASGPCNCGAIDRYGKLYMWGDYYLGNGSDNGDNNLYDLSGWKDEARLIKNIMVSTYGKRETLYSTTRQSSKHDYRFEKISLGWRHAVGVIKEKNSSKKRVVVWGSGGCGQLGLGKNEKEVFEHTQPYRDEKRKGNDIDSVCALPVCLPFFDNMKEIKLVSASYRMSYVIASLGEIPSCAGCSRENCFSCDSRDIRILEDEKRMLEVRRKLPRGEKTVDDSLFMFGNWGKEQSVRIPKLMKSNNNFVKLESSLCMMKGIGFHTHICGLTRQGRPVRIIKIVIENRKQKNEFLNTEIISRLDKYEIVDFSVGGYFVRFLDKFGRIFGFAQRESGCVFGQFSMISDSRIRRYRKVFCSSVSPIGASIDENGYVYVWGRDSGGALGLGESRDTYGYLNHVRSLRGEKVTSVAFGRFISNQREAFGRFISNQREERKRRRGFEKKKKKRKGSSRPAIEKMTGSYSTLFLTENGDVYQCGMGIAIPTKMESLKDIVSISCSGYGGHCGAIDKHGRLYMWGVGRYGQIGDGTLKSQDVPIRIDEFSKSGKLYSLDKYRFLQVSCCGGATIGIAEKKEKAGTGKGEKTKMLLFWGRTDKTHLATALGTTTMKRKKGKTPKKGEEEEPGIWRKPRVEKEYEIRRRTEKWNRKFPTYVPFFKDTYIRSGLITTNSVGGASFLIGVSRENQGLLTERYKKRLRREKNRIREVRRKNNKRLHRLAKKCVSRSDALYIVIVRSVNDKYRSYNFSTKKTYIVFRLNNKNAKTESFELRNSSSSLMLERKFEGDFDPQSSMSIRVVSKTGLMKTSLVGEGELPLLRAAKDFVCENWTDIVLHNPKLEEDTLELRIAVSFGTDGEIQKDRFEYDESGLIEDKEFFETESESEESEEEEEEEGEDETEESVESDSDVDVSDDSSNKEGSETESGEESSDSDQ